MARGRPTAWRLAIALASVPATLRSARADPPAAQAPLAPPLPLPPPSPSLAPAPTPAAGPGATTGFRSFVRDLSAGADLLGTVPTIAVFDGSWSIGLHIGSFLTSRTWRAPYPRGILAQESTRILYGTSWTAMLGLESLAVVVATGARFAWLAEATYHSDWMFGVSLPSCPRPGAFGGCGVGVGGFGGIRVRPIGTRWWLEASGGWIEQRVANDERRTLSESAWVMTPIAAAYDLRTGESPLALRAEVGPGLYFGMHNAHVHPTTLGERTLDVPWHEIYALDAGAGPGARVAARAVFFRRVSLDGELIVAPFLVGGPTTHPSHDVAPLDEPRAGTPVWRWLAAGASVDPTPMLPMRAGVALFGAELSGRPLARARLGHAGVMLRFEFPLRLPSAAPAPAAAPAAPARSLLARPTEPREETTP